MNNKQIIKELQKLNTKATQLREKKIFLKAKERFEYYDNKYTKMYKEILKIDEYVSEFNENVKSIMGWDRCPLGINGEYSIGKYRVALDMKCGHTWTLAINDLSKVGYLGEQIICIKYSAYHKDKKKHKKPATLSKAISMYGIDTNDKLEALYQAIDMWSNLKKIFMKGEYGVDEHIKYLLNECNKLIDNDLIRIESKGVAV